MGFLTDELELDREVGIPVSFPGWSDIEVPELDRAEETPAPQIYYITRDSNPSIDHWRAAKILAARSGHPMVLVNEIYGPAKAKVDYDFECFDSITEDMRLTNEAVQLLEDRLSELRGLDRVHIKNDSGEVVGRRRVVVEQVVSIITDVVWSADSWRPKRRGE